MRRILGALVLLALFFLCACGQTTLKEKGAGFVRISQEEAKRIMDAGEGCVILDVRTEQEYAQGHIPNAILLPDYAIEDCAEEVLPEKDQLILVYCRSGRRSVSAAMALAELGYTNVKEFGGILDWKYEIV